MVNILIPCMGKSTFFKDSFFPKLLTEIKGRTMLETVIDNYARINAGNFIFILDDKECKEFHMDSSVRILSPSSIVIRLKNHTRGALCTCLMAIDYINGETPLIIANSDQMIDVDYNVVLRQFGETNAGAGVITFPSIHPRWCYAKKQSDEVVEVAEKRPLSRDAIAGFYYYGKGSDFVECAKRALLKGNSHNGQFYISASVNEMILAGKKVGYFDVEKEKYHSFYSPEKIKEYEEEKHL